MRIKEGDVFLIPVATGRVAVGQVVYRYRRGTTPWFMVVYDGTYPRDPVPHLADALERPIRLQAITFDPLIRMGRWPRVGNRAPPTDRILWPIFKVMTSPPDTWAVIDHTMKLIRPASRRDVDELPMYTSVGPILLEHAAQALAGLAAWSPDYEDLLPPGSRLDRASRMILPSWVFRLGWAVHRGVYALSGHRLGTARARPNGLGTLFLETVGRKSGTVRRNALGYLEDGPNLAVVASNAGADTDPSWWLNLQARPAAWVEIGGRRSAITGRAATGEERQRLWGRFVALNAGYDAYRQATTRQIPVVVLEPRTG